MSHLCLLNLLVIAQYVHVIEMTPICGRTDASSSSSSSLEAKNTDKIYFLDPQQSVHTQVINGTLIYCFADGTIINATSADAAEAAASNDDGLKLRMGKLRPNASYCVSSKL